MKTSFLTMTIFGLLCSALGQQERPINPDDPKGIMLPRGVPRTVDTNGMVVDLPINFTTKQYQEAAFELVLQEADLVAIQLRLPGESPITRSNIIGAFISPFGFNYVNNAIGNITTSNYCYCVSVGNRFSYLVGTHQGEDCQKYEELYTWPVSRIDTNQAYQLAAQWLGDLSMDVKALNRDCSVTVEPERDYINVPVGKFVPVYFVSWMKRGPEGGGAASVRVFTPTKTLLQLRVEDPKYILRSPLVFTNLDSLFPGTGRVQTLPPPEPGPMPGN